VLRLSHPLPLFALAIWAPVIAAQNTLAPQPGARLRIYFANDSALKRGTLEQITPETLVFRPCANCGVVSAPRATVNRFEVDAGPGGRPLIGAALGLLTGAAIGAFVVAPCPHGNAGADGPPCGLGQSLATVNGAFVGLVLGTAVGAWLLPRHHWRRGSWP
jgi:hypothetical protein